MSSIPYSLPSANETTAREDSATACIERFQVNTSSFACRSFTPESLAESLHHEILTCCKQQGLIPTDSREADIHITGTVYAVDEGSQFLRYMLPFLAGASLVHVEGAIHIRGGPPRPFKQIVRSRIAAFGGRSKKLIQLALQRVGLFVAGEAANQVSPAAQQNNRSVATYIQCVGGAAVLVTLTSAILGYRWATDLPITNNSIKPGEIPVWAAVVAVAAFLTSILIATAFAPTRVLKSRGMIWLVALSGTKSILALRAILFILAAVAGTVFIMCFVAAKGS